MKVLYQSRDLSRAEKAAVFFNQSANLKECSGQTIIVSAMVKYEDVNSKGENITLMAFLTDDEVITTTSKTVMRSFERMVDGLEINMTEENVPIKIIEGVSKNGRTYYDVQYDRSVG